MSEICRLYVGNMSPFCRTYVDFMSETCRFFVGSMSPLCRKYVDFVLAKFELGQKLCVENYWTSYELGIQTRKKLEFSFKFWTSLCCILYIIINSIIIDFLNNSYFRCKDTGGISSNMYRIIIRYLEIYIF